MKRIVFAGYAPVHFISFEPIYRRLSARGDIRIDLSGGQEPGTEGRGMARAEDLYRPFDVPKEHVIELPEMFQRSYDMVFSAHTKGYFPREDKVRVNVFHGLSFRNMAVRRDLMIYDALFVVGPYMMRMLTESKLYRPGDPRLVPVGFVKVDRLIDGSLDRRAILRSIGFAGDRPVVLYAPTGQRYNSLETTGPEVIRRLRDSNKYDILIKLHDHPRDPGGPGHQQLLELLDDHTKLGESFDVVPYLFASDLLITDASSVSSEYSLLDRPMVFLDVPELLAAAAAKGVMLDLETWGRRGGTTARWPDDAVNAVEWSLQNPEAHSDVRRAMAADLFYNPGRATDAAVAWTLDKLGLSATQTSST